jgi:hypothetical protein
VKRLRDVLFDPVKARSEWSDYSDLLRSRPTLGESSDILPFFRAHDHLSLLISGYYPNIRDPTHLGHEFQIYGDFAADLVIGDRRAGSFLLVEFEDATPTSIFRTSGGRSNPQWAPRFEAAFSQLLDWLWKLEDMRSTENFEHVFGRRDARFQGLIVIGKDMSLDAQEESRLRWRVEKLRVDSKAISCVSFDELRDDFDFWLSKYYGV